MSARPHIFRWDLDKTYLATEFDSLGDLLRTALQRPADKANVPGSAELLALADSLREIRTICWCGRKATMVVRLDEEGRILEDGDQVSIGGEESYVSLCRRHWEDRDVGPNSQLKMFL